VNFLDQNSGWLGLPPESSWEVKNDLSDSNPFVEYRKLLWSYHLATTKGLSDQDFLTVVKNLDEAVSEIETIGFQETPLVLLSELSEAIGQNGGVWAKNETVNVSGSHKARHLFGLAIRLELEEVSKNTPLTIASCGNAALAASVIAKAAKRTLTVNVPTWAETSLLDELSDNGAQVQICERRSDESGDPCMLRFRELLEEGALPFGCQGTENIWTIDGGKTLGFEMSTQLNRYGLEPDRLLVQVGGGALASSTMQALTDAKDLGILKNRPALNTVQATGCSPLSIAYNRIADSDNPSEALSEAISIPLKYMEPWENPSSAATGILDDITYDWLPLVWDMIFGDNVGGPLSASEEKILLAKKLVADHTDISASATGTAGLAGLLAAKEDGCINSDDSVIILLTGVDREF
jgi:threonine dehydratase